MKTSTVALVIQVREEIPTIVDILCDEQEISFFEIAIRTGDAEALEHVYQHRKQEAEHDEELGNYIEELLSRSVVRAEIQEHGVQWLKSKIKIEQYQKAEKEAAQVIAEYAYKIFRDDSTKTDFFLTGPKSQVRIRIFDISKNSAPTPSESA